MRRSAFVFRIGLIRLVMLLGYTVIINAQEEIFQKNISLPRQNSTTYSILNQISNQIDYYFVYDNEVVNSDKKVRIKKDNKALSLWLDEIIDDPHLEFNLIENHILIHHAESENYYDNESNEKVDDLITLEGRVLDGDSGNPLPYATVAIKGKAFGIITNSDGVFVLKVSNEYIDDQISVSHLGFQSQIFPVQMLKNNKLDVLMKTKYISIPEVQIQYFDPLTIVETAMNKINENYCKDPVYLFNFYREGVQRNNKFINYSEAFFQIYKSSYHRKYEGDRVRLLQSRTISNVDQSDTLILKIRAGVKSSLELDFVKNTPDFLDMKYMDKYDFTSAEIITVDGKNAYAVAFEQKDHITEPLGKGVLYIDMESMAFLGADFEVHPEYVNKAQNQFIARRNMKYRANIDRVAYTVNYKYYDGRYHLNHVRADLHIRYRKRYHLFSNNYHVFVEMATSRIETEGIERFNRRDAMRTNKIFVDGNYEYDHNFWSGFSIIEPEKHITRALSRIDSKIESIVAD